MTRRQTKPDARGTDRGRPARRRWRDVFDFVLPGIVIAIVVILAVLAVLSVGVFQNASRASDAARTARAAVKRQRLISVNGCQRVQRLRDDTNVISWGVYNALDMSRGPDPRRIRQLLTAVDPATRALIVTLLTSSEQSRPTLVRVRAAQGYLPPTNCKIASRDPEYRFPSQIPWMKVECYDPARNPRPVKCPR